MKLDTIFAERFRISMKRMEICRTCDKFKPDNKKCLVCRCFMDYKTLLLDSKCPLDKWQAEKVLNSPSDQESK